jgi:hypothetical protein
VLSRTWRHLVEALIVPIRAILKAERPPFGRAEIAGLTAAFEAALHKLEVVDRYDRAAIAIAKLIVIEAKKGSGTRRDLAATS